MADLKQGVEYELTAKDSTGPGVESAKATVEEGAKAAAKSTDKVAKDFKAGFSPMSAITAALSGNFQALGQQMAGLVTRLKGVHMSMMQFSLYAALVMAHVKAVSAGYSAADLTGAGFTASVDSAAASCYFFLSAHRPVLIHNLPLFINRKRGCPLPGTPQDICISIIRY